MREFYYRTLSLITIFNIYTLLVAGKKGTYMGVPITFLDKYNPDEFDMERALKEIQEKNTDDIER